MKTKQAALSKAQQLQNFMQEAAEHFPDLLTLDGETAWSTLFPDRAVPFGLRSLWRRKQVELAAPRILQVAAPLDIPLQTERDRGHLATLLLSDKYALSDDMLIV